MLFKLIGTDKEKESNLHSLSCLRCEALLKHKVKQVMAKVAERANPRLHV
jgi:hypothetical protein